MRRILSILLENESGALSRVIGLFSQRGYNIETITVAPTEDATLSKMTIQTVGDEKAIEQIEKQLHKLIDVLRVVQINQSSYIEREIMLLKVQMNNYRKDDIKHVTEIFRGQIVDITSTTYILQLSGTTKKLDSFLKIIRNISEVIEVTRSGIVGISRG
ncbi:acetolactate synthase small subunit [Buchnera aphidicola]|uniref:Acetolactate synthase small subunit n=1 Tax=Buchnera aphidicola str. USDA (Myzus persicae) TaxID=1009856 RepID=W0P455_BUCMP|nr:acetolactate synthase small subunit [Buchnera aphidicola]AHG60150.1 Ilvh [Buchnera aphidicola str. USDA (Myzus persicae)]AHG60730.1 Ilvh [Buchnera aphidicola str. W106 (Myzus persicae)]AHG61302.1 Ilvh [Buchnera aphidicola str. G002 (Myzus persicae)]AHG61875.1 Ilvh [Buchnera aphidicola str. F009 (Myzus persicae)]WAI03160.1 MAG: acetolactate synthase small subunit [Buchnera aphidicola (Myzus persicae)]